MVRVKFDDKSEGLVDAYHVKTIARPPATACGCFRVKARKGVYKQRSSKKMTIDPRVNEIFNEHALFGGLGIVVFDSVGVCVRVCVCV